MRDVRSTHRLNWQAVKLRQNAPMVTLQEWDEFRAIYLSKRALVEDWMDTEDRQLVFAQVPSGLQPRVLTETAKRRRGQLRVRVVVPEGLDVQQVRTEFEKELGYPLSQIVFGQRHFEASCDSLEQQRWLLEWDGAKVDPTAPPIKVQQAEYQMTGNEILAYVRQLLVTEDELRIVRAAYQLPALSPKANQWSSQDGGIQVVQGAQDWQKKTSTESMKKKKRLERWQGW